MPTAIACRATAVAAPPAVLVSAAAAAAFRHQLGTAASTCPGSMPGGYRADVTGAALAALTRTFDFDTDVIAVLDHAQFERCAVTVTPRGDGSALLACAGDTSDGFRPARRPPAR